MNILLIAIDTLSARHMSCYGYHRDTTPFIDNLARQGVLFESHYCQAIPTQPAYTSVYTGQYAVTHGIVSHGGTRYLSPKAPCLPALLRQHGYTTCAVDNLYGMKEWFARGYEFYIYPSKEDYDQATLCEGFNARAIPWLNGHAEESFFLFVHYWDPHTPYLPPERYRSLYYDGDPCDPENTSLEGFWRHPFSRGCKSWFDQLRPGITDVEYIAAMHDSEIRYVDDGVKELLTTLDDLGLGEQTLVILFSDHGEIMHKHGIYFDHHGLYDEDIHVPLIVRWPGQARPDLRVPHLVQHIDIAPTILDAAGIEVPGEMEGTSLLPYLKGERNDPIYPFLVAEECTRMMKWGLRTREYKFILSRQQDYLNLPPRELYNLDDDPQEMNNIAEGSPEVVQDMEQTLEGWISDMMRKNGLKEDPLVSNGVTLAANWVQWIKEHGYW